ncbi:MAG: hypothetical protein ABJE10_00740 [bacterium]
MRRSTLFIAVALVVGCSGEKADGNYRGHGLKPAALAPAAEAAVYAAALGAMFDADPTTTFLAHPRLLPRSAGLDGGDSIPPALVHALRTRGVIKGSCEPRREGVRDTPRCPVPQTGYVLRASPTFRIAGDTVQINLSAETFGPATGKKPDALRLEKVYQLVGSGTTWRVLREGRVHSES